MSVSSTDNQIIYTGSGTTGPFDFDFKVYRTSDLLVQKLLIATEVVTDLTETTDYTVALDVDGTGSVTTVAVVASTYKLIITRSLPITQEITYVENDKFPSATHEEGLDRGVMIDQQLQEQIDRCVKVVAGSATNPDQLIDDLNTASTAAVAAAADAVIAQSAAEAAQVAAAASAASINFTKDTDGTMAANSDAVVPSQKAVRTYVAAQTPTGVLGNGTVGLVNLLKNGDFENWSAGTSTYPDYWVAELTPTIARDTGDVGYSSYSCKVTATGAGLEGIKFTTPTLKPSTSYTFSVRVKATAGDTASIITTGATANISLESTSATFETKTGTFVTDGSGTAVVIKLLAKADTDIVWFDGAMLTEGASQFAFTPHPNDLHSLLTWTDYGATSTIVGFSLVDEKEIFYRIDGKTVYVIYAIGGTSNATNFTFTLPIAPTGTFRVPTGYTEDNTTWIANGAISLNGTTTVTVNKSASSSWTNSGSKRVRGQFFYQIA
jgi:hypothetical protein